MFRRAQKVNKACACYGDGIIMGIDSYLSKSELPHSNCWHDVEPATAALGRYCANAFCEMNDISIRLDLLIIIDCKPQVDKALRHSHWRRHASNNYSLFAQFVSHTMPC